MQHPPCTDHQSGSPKCGRRSLALFGYSLSALWHFRKLEVFSYHSTGAPFQGQNGGTAPRSCHQRTLALSPRTVTHFEKPCSFFKIASDEGRSARSSGVRQWPEAAASSSADMLNVSASIG